MALKISKAPRTFVPLWKGNRDLPVDEQISAVYRTLSIEDVFTVQQKTSTNLMAGFKLDREDPQSISDYWRLVRWVVEGFVDGWKNIVVDSIELTKSVDVIAALGTGHMELLGEVFGQVMQDSSGTETESKNSVSESVLTSEGSDGPASDVLPMDSEKSVTAEESILTPSMPSLAVTT